MKLRFLIFITGAMLLCWGMAPFSLASDYPKKSSACSILFSAAQYTQKVLKNASNYLAGEASVWHFFHEKGASQKALRATQEFVRSSLRLLSPFPHRLLANPTENIFKKQWKDPEYKPSPQEILLLDKYRAIETFDQKAEFMKTHPRWTIAQKTASHVARAAMFLSVGLAFNHMEQARAHLISAEQYLEGQDYKLETNQVQIVVDIVPFPHLALRIGDKIYSYGFTHLSAKPTVLYLYAKQIERNAKEKGIDVSKNKDLQTRLIDSVDKFPRSIQVVTLNLTHDEVLKLKRDLEMGTAQRYYNSTFVNDCSTMIVRALRRNTSIDVSSIIDASPSQVAMYFSALKTAGDPKVGSVLQVAIEEPDAPYKHLLRNTYINMMESKLFIALAYINFPHRVGLEIFRDEADLQSLDPEVAAAIQKWREDVQDLLEHDAQIKLFEESIAISEDRKLLAAMIHDYFDEQIQNAKEVQNNLNSDFKDILYSQFQIELLHARKQELLKRLEQH